MVTRIKKRNAFYTLPLQARPLAGPAGRQMGALAGNAAVSVNTWETIVARGDRAIQAWIDKNMTGKSCAVVLIGARIARRKWINYEIEKAWNDGKGVLGIQIHRIRNIKRLQSPRGRNPFADFVIGTARPPVSDTKAYNPAPHRQR